MASTEEELDQLRATLSNLGIYVGHLSDDKIKQLSADIGSLSENVDAASAKFQALTEITVNEKLGDAYDDATKRIAAAKMAENQKALEKDLLDWMTDSGSYSGKQNFAQADAYGNEDAYKELLKRFNDAMGGGYKRDSNFVRGDDTDRSFAFKNAMGKEEIYTAEELANIIAASEALQELGKSAEEAAAQVQGMSEGEKKYLASGSGEGLTKKEWSELQAAAGTSERDQKNYLKSLGYTGDALKAEREKLANALSIPFDELITGLDGAGFASGLTENLTAGSAKALTDALANINLGPAGEKAGEKFVEGFNKIAADLGDLSEEDQEAAMNALAGIDWTAYDALEQADNILQQYGKDIDTTSDYWVDFAKQMREATYAQPDFTKMKNDLVEVSGILNNLSFGSVISDEDLKKLTAYKAEWADFFQMQADGSMKFIGDEQAMKQAMQDNIREQMKDLADRAKAQEKFVSGKWGTKDENGVHQTWSGDQWKDWSKNASEESLRNVA